MGIAKSELLEKDSIIGNLEDERSRFQSELDKLKASGGSGDHRAKARLERQRILAVKEVELLREQIRTFDSEEMTYHSENEFDALKQKRIQELESLVDEYRSELQTLNTTLSSHEDQKPAPNANPLKRPFDDTNDENKNYLGELTRKNRTLQANLSALEKSFSFLQSEHQAATSQIAHLQSSLQTRVLALRSNPTADAEGKSFQRLLPL